MTNTRHAEPERLSDYVRRIIKEKGLSGRIVADNAGGEITQGYISQIINEEVKSIGVDKIKALAKGLGEPIWDVIAAAFGEDLNTLPAQREKRLRSILSGVDDLDKDVQAEIDAGLKFMEKAIDTYKRTKK